MGRFWAEVKDSTILSHVGSSVGELRDTKIVLRTRFGVQTLEINITANSLTFAYPKTNSSIHNSSITRLKIY